MTTKLDEMNMEVDTPIKQRLYKLMTSEERQMPFKFANRVGISPSTFHSLWTKGASSMHKRTAEKIANATNADAAWVQTGIGRPYVNVEDIVEIYPADGISVVPMEYEEPEHIKNMNPVLLMEALAMVEEVLTETGKQMDAMNKAEFTLRVYELLALNPEPTQEYKNTLKRTLKIA